MSGWRRCDTCRKVRPTEVYDGGATTCHDCLTAPAPRKKAAPVTTTRVAAAPKEPAAPKQPATRSPLLGSVGSGDLEVRERRARRKALEQLAESHPEEFGLLLRDARAAEGLRPLHAGTPSPVTDAAAPDDAGAVAQDAAAPEPQ